MNRKQMISVVQKVIRYLANILLGISLMYFIASWILVGSMVFTYSLFWVVLIALWQVVIMLILTEQFYLLKK